MSKIYCGIGKVPKGHRIGTMVECLEKGKVNLYGLHKIDPKLVKEKLNSKKKGSKKDKTLKESEVRLFQAGLRGRVTALNNELKMLEKEDDDRNASLIKKIKKQIDLIKDEFNKLNDVIKKIKDGKEIKNNLKDIEKKFQTVSELKGEKKATKKKKTTKK